MSTRSVPDGVDLLRFLSEVEADPDAWVQAVGFVEEVELAVPRGADEERIILAGRAALVSLAGPKRGPLFVLLALAGDGPPGDVKLTGGRLVRARSLGVEVTALGGEEPAPDTAREAVGSSVPPREGWAEAAVASRAREDRNSEEEAEEGDELPAFGDRIDHFVFGVCDVMVVHGERMKVRDLGASGKLRELHLGAVRVQKPAVKDGKRVFKLLRKT